MRLRISVCWACVVLATSASAQSLAGARDMTARAKVLDVEAGSALAQGDRATWASKSDESLKLLREASRIYREMGIESSDDPYLLEEYANALDLARDFDLAAQIFERLTRLEPENAIWRLKLGVALVETGPLHRKRAKTNLERALGMAGDEATAAAAASALGQMYWDASHFDAAARYSEQALGVMPNDVRAATNLAGVSIRNGEVADAYRTLSALTSFRGDEFARIQVTVSQALNDFEQRRAWFEDEAASHAAYARLLSRVGRNSEAVLALRRAVQLEPEDTGALNLLGSILRTDGDAVGARAAYEQSLRANPDQPPVRESLRSLN